MSERCLRPLQNFVIIMLAAFSALNIYGQKKDSPYSVCDDCLFVIKSNLLYDAILTPDIGVEISVSPKVSVGIEGVCAWWSKNSAHRYWRIRGGWLDASWWFGDASQQYRLTGHHAGIYASIHDYDFEFGDKGWQSSRPTFGVGLTYGYSFRLNRHLNLDLCVRAGYAGGRVTEYRPMCGTYTAIRERSNNYFGITGLGINLVWFTGLCKSCKQSR